MTASFVRAASERQRFNVLGAWNALTRELIAITNTTVVNTETMCDLLRKIAALGLTGPITLVPDNARYQRNAAFRSRQCATPRPAVVLRKQINADLCTSLRLRDVRGIVHIRLAFLPVGARSMTKTPKHALIAALTVLAVMSLPRPCSADQVYGTWTGAESYSIEYYLEDGTVISQSSGSLYPATLSVEFDSNINVAPPQETAAGMGITGFYSIWGGAVGGYGPQSAGMYIIDDTSYPEGYAFGNFDATFQSILPDGSIDTTGGFAVADIDIQNYSDGVYERAFISFQTVPEPSSLLLVLAGAATVLLLAPMRFFALNPGQ